MKEEGLVLGLGKGGRGKGAELEDRRIEGKRRLVVFDFQYAERRSVIRRKDKERERQEAWYLYINFSCMFFANHGKRSRIFSLRKRSHSDIG